jgi:hypothetical protein
MASQYPLHADSTFLIALHNASPHGPHSPLFPFTLSSLPFILSLPHISVSELLHLLRRGDTMRWTDLLWYALDCLCMVIVCDTYDLVSLSPGQLAIV